MISVPTLFSATQIRLVQEIATQVAQLPNISVLGESSAIAYAYLWTQQKELKALPEGQIRNVLFFDFGETKFSLHSMSFQANQSNIVLSDSLRLGVAHIDHLLCRRILQDFAKSNSSFNVNDQKYYQKLYETVAVSRKKLSPVESVNILIECFFQDEDLNFNLTKDFFNQMLDQEYSQTVSNFLLNYLEK